MTSLATKQEITEIKRTFAEGIQKNAEAIEKVDDRIRMVEEGFDARVSSVLSQRIAEEKSNRTGLLTLSVEEQAKERKYHLARRAIHLWPVETGPDLARNIRKFLLTQLEIPADKLDNIQIEHAERIDQGRRSRIVNEVMVRFPSPDVRDLVQSYAPNLAGKREVGIRMNIPQHLRGLFKLFETHGGKLKQQHGDGLKRSIKFHDPTQSLIMDVRLPNDNEWVRIHNEEIIKISKEWNQKNDLFAQANRGGPSAERFRKILLKSPQKNKTVLTL